MNILADSQIPFAEQFFSDLGTVTTLAGRAIDAKALQDVDVLLVRSVTRVNEALLQGSSIQFIGTATSGIDHIDQDYCQQQGITVAYAPGSNARSVAEYILSALFALHETSLKELTQKTVGIVGYGHVGTIVEKLLSAIGMQCLLCDPPLAKIHNAPDFVTLETILDCDIISLHVPLTEQGEHPTRHLIDAKQLQAMRPDSILINSARGGVVNEKALLAAIQDQSITAVIDTWQSEPQINMDLMQQAAIATPHIAGYSQDGKFKATAMLHQFVCRYFENISDASQAPLHDLQQNYVDIQETENEQQMLKTMIFAAYDCRDDHQALLKSQAMPAAERGAYFDQLRRDYPVRREFQNYHYDPKAIAPGLRDTLQTLGFQALENHSGEHT